MTNTLKKLALAAAVLALAGWQATAWAEGADPAKKDAAGGAKPAPAKEAAKPAPESPLVKIVGADVLPMLEKKYPRMVKERLDFEEASAELKEALTARDSESKRDKRKGERDAPKIHAKMSKISETLQKEYEKSVKPFQGEWDRLKDQDERLITRMARAETDPKRNEKEIAKLQTQREELDKELNALDKTMTALRKLADVKVEPLDK
jgi:hypothetical protein